MFNYAQLLIDSTIYISTTTFFLLALILNNPRLLLQDYPPAIKEIAPPKTEAEKRQSLWLGMPFLLVLLIFPLVATFRLGENSFINLFLYTFGMMCRFSTILNNIRGK